MPGFPLTVTTSLSCFHQAPATVPPSQQAVSIMGGLVATMSGQIAVAGCPFAPGGVAQPCVTIKWSQPSTKVTIMGQPLLLMPPPDAGIAPGVCLAAAPQGAATVKANQAKVTAL